jgi:hypothetical protein
MLAVFIIASIYSAKEIAEDMGRWVECWYRLVW